MILQLLKNHPTTARMLRPEAIRNCTFMAMAALFLLLPATTLNAQRSFDAEADTSSDIYQAYQQQLKENQRRLSGSDDAYQQQMQQNQAAQIYMPPVHIAPQAPARRPSRPRSLNGRFNSVQNYATPNNPAQMSLSDEQRNRVPTVATEARRNTRPRRDSGTRDRRQSDASSTEHVFLQDRIASALTRTFGGSRANKTEKSPRPSAVTPRNPMPDPVVFPALESDDLTGEPNQFVSNEAEFEYTEPEYAVQQSEPTERRHSVLEHSDDEILIGSDALESETEEELEQETDFQLADVIPPRVFITENPLKDDSLVVTSSYQAKRRGINVAKRTRRLKAPRPASYRPRQNRLRASEVSVLVGQEKEESLEDLDFDLPLDEKDTQDSLSDEELSSPLRSKAGSGTKPEQRDDLDSMEDDDREQDRIRSRLNDDLDEIDELDDIDDEDFDDDDEPEIERPTTRPCNEFRDELLSTSIRDISLDISPGAYSETSRFGGLNRSWTDRSGNVIASGTMVDLRRGYVILDSGQKIPYAKLGVPDLAAVSKFWRLPTVCLLGNRGGSPHRSWAQQTVTWKASSLCHKPLYFENRQLERYGHSRGPFAQPVHSTVHFFTSLISLPYQTAITPANECQYALGFFRPGGCAPWLKDPIPISLEGARRQALLTTGGAFIP